ncbi:MAG: divergent PAP2 family protein [Treponemataceae bacterium]|nr:divergent PAP2 family protein [Treponemataceae bacterium]
MDTQQTINAYQRLENLIKSPVFISIIFAWLSAQFIKTIIRLCQKKIHSVSEFFESLFWSTGGMPSSHTAVVVAVCTTIGFKDGFDTDIFMLACCLTLITIRDALGVRRATGIQAMKINEIGRYLSGKDDIDIASVKEIQGHKPLEVLGGAILGLAIGIVFSLFIRI